ncbi:MAG: transcriptional regulator [Chloroflexi bacterium]|nr:transcriptional regulator [Chloroflexota bacterium]
MKSTRDRILQTLLTHPNAAISDLAEAVDINNISVRHHLTNLQAEGYIRASEERHGVGRPRLVYSLTETGLERFPTRYLNLTKRLLDQMKSSLPQPQIDEIFIRMARSIASDQAEKIKNLTIEKKLDYIRKSLEEEGFMIEWKKVGNEYHLLETSCPFYHIGQSHPEVCVLDQTLISSILSVPTEKTQCVLNGDVHCTYVIQEQSLAELS